MGYILSTACAELLQDVQKITHKGYLNMLNNYSVLKYSKKVGVFTCEYCLPAWVVQFVLCSRG